MTFVGASASWCGSRLTRAFTRSANGTVSVTPGARVRLYRLNRSTTNAVSPGTTLTAMATSTRSTSTTPTPAPTAAGMSGTVPGGRRIEWIERVRHRVDDRGGAVDLHHLDAASGRDRRLAVEGLGRPQLATQADRPAAVGRDLLHHHAAAPDDVRDAGLELTVVVH